MAETVNTFIKSSLRLLNVKESGENLTADELADGIIALNDLIELMNLQPLMQPAKLQLTQVLTPSDGTYTFGTGGNNTTRPVRINHAFIRDTSVNDIPVAIIGSEQYAYITTKTDTASYPCYLYYRDSYPLGVVNLYPVPSVAYTLYLEVQANLSTYSSGSEDITLPPGYKKYMRNQLAIDISPEYKEASQAVYKAAADAEAWIKRMNNIDKPTMSNPARRAVGGYSFSSFLSGG